MGTAVTVSVTSRTYFSEMPICASQRMDWEMAAKGTWAASHAMQGLLTGSACTRHIVLPSIA